MRTLLTLGLFEVDVVLVLALLVVQARADLGAVLRIAICVLQAPVSELEVPSLGVPQLPSAICDLPGVVGAAVMQALAHVVIRVDHLTNVAVPAVQV